MSAFFFGDGCLCKLYGVCKWDFYKNYFLNDMCFRKYYYIIYNHNESIFSLRDRRWIFRYTIFEVIRLRGRKFESEMKNIIFFCDTYNFI